MLRPVSSKRFFVTTGIDTRKRDEMINFGARELEPFPGFRRMNSAATVFMIATYWVGGSGTLEGGKHLASGHAYNKDEFIAAHRTLPFGTLLNVCLRRQCVSVVVKDRGPYLAKMDLERRIDLSYAAAKALDMLHDGRQRVRVSVPVPAPRPSLEGESPRVER